MRVDVGRLLNRLGIEARKKSREWYARCPNPEHEDHSPSWRMRDEPGSSRHGFFHCHPCGFGGTPVDLVMKLRGIVSRREAARWIEGEVGLDQDPVDAVEVKVQPPPLRFRLPLEVRVDAVDQWPSSIREYLAFRGIEEWQVERWGLGYAVDGRLAGRIVVPSRDSGGRPTRYTARTFIDSEKRYLEPEPQERASPAAMFGEQHWPLLNSDEDRHTLFVVEGAINGLALEAELPGVYFGATAGSDLRAEHAIKIATWRRVFAMTDSDPAGDLLAGEIASKCARHSDVIRARLPDGVDPSLMRRTNPGMLGQIARRLLWDAAEKSTCQTTR